MTGPSLRPAWIVSLVLSAPLWAQPVAAQAPGGFVRINGGYPVSTQAPFETTLEIPLCDETAAYGISHEPAKQFFADATVGAREVDTGGLQAGAGLRFRF